MKLKMKNKIKNYSVSIPWHCSVVVQVAADSREEAEAKALKIASPSLCHQCSHQVNLGDVNLDVEPDVEELKD
jgi:hypothetical protein